MKKITLLITLILTSTLSVNSQVLLTETFEDITTLTDWDQVNVSVPIGTVDWFQGNPAVFVAQEGADTSYIGANFNSVTGANDISNWLILPVLSLKDGDVLTFYTRTGEGSTFPDRLQVRVSADGAGSTAPSSPTDLGSYTNLLLDINPTLDVGGYPNLDWELQTVTISGLGETEVDARLAFRYVVANGGPAGDNSNYIGIDTLEVSSTLSLNEFNANTFTHFYNKDTDNLTLNSSDLALSKVALYNILGQQVFNKTLSSTSEVIGMSGLEDGIYLAKVSIQGKTQTLKILKQ